MGKLTNKPTYTLPQPASDAQKKKAVVFVTRDSVKKIYFWEAVYCSVLLTQYYVGDKIENEIGGARSANGRGERRAQDIGGETWRKEASGETQA